MLTTAKASSLTAATLLALAAACGSGQHAQPKFGTSSQASTSLQTENGLSSFIINASCLTVDGMVTAPTDTPPPAPACDPTLDPTCTPAAPPPAACDPTIDPTCTPVAPPPAPCDPTLDPTSTAAAPPSSPTCDPTADTPSDPTLDPTLTDPSRAVPRAAP